VITPRTTRLWRVPDLRAMHASIARLTSIGAAPGSRAVIVPTRGAAEELRRTLEHLRLPAAAAGDAAILLPDVLTRDDLYARLHQRLPDAPPLLSPFEREVMLRRAARDTAEQGRTPPFGSVGSSGSLGSGEWIRPGLVIEILAFYDELRRRDKTLDDFERLMVGSLEPSAEIDRGAARMLQQTRFLAAALGRFERKVAECGRVDEHGLRTLLLARPCEPRYSHVIVTAADRAADPHGLWPADFDLLTRLPGVETIDILATENLLAAGFHERVHRALPGIEEETGAAPSSPPVLVAPEPAPGEEGTRWFLHRDREEELVSVARLLRIEGNGVDAERAVVFQRPLPYLYLARHVFADAGVPYHALDALPLAAEPFVAALDLAFTFLIAEGTRGSLTALLRSPHWSFSADGQALNAQQTNAADDLLQRVKYLGGFDRLSSLAEEARTRAAAPAAETRRRRRQLWPRAAVALRAADAAAVPLRGVAAAPTASAQIDALLTFVKAHERMPAADDPWRARHLRARSAVLAALESLRDAHAAHDDEPLPIADLAASIRRWIEGQTFSPRTGSAGVRLIDAHAAPYAHVDELRIVGLVESDWPEPPRRSIFYPASLLGQLGWPGDAERASAARARFQDLLTLPRLRVSASTFTLEDDAIVPPSPFLDDIETAGLAVERVRVTDDVRVLAREALSEAPFVESAVAGHAADWLALRMSRSPADGAAFHGSAGPRAHPVHAVSYVERYLECPFKYFAAHVLQLPEEADDETGLTPQERGQFLHDVFEAFFARWHAAGRRAITADNVGEALTLFESVAEDRLLTLNEADRALERTHLLGSAVSAGLAERAFAFEIDHQADVFDRLLEYELEGEFEFRAGDVTRAVHVRSKADRIDLLTDGTLRVIDYKLGRAPKRDRALQLAIYGACAEQRLKGHAGRDWKLARAAYVAFRERNPYVPLASSGPLEDAVAEGQARFLKAVDAIESGAFAVDPAEPYRCQWCAYPTVCRKDYVGDE
jgi:RecB family exonuclease